MGSPWPALPSPWASRRRRLPRRPSRLPSCLPLARWLHATPPAPALRAGLPPGAARLDVPGDGPAGRAASENRRAVRPGRQVSDPGTTVQGAGSVPALSAGLLASGVSDGQAALCRHPTSGVSGWAGHGAGFPHAAPQSPRTGPADASGAARSTRERSRRAGLYATPGDRAGVTAAQPPDPGGARAARPAAAGAPRLRAGHCPRPRLGAASVCSAAGAARDVVGAGGDERAGRIAASREAFPARLCSRQSRPHPPLESRPRGRTHQPAKEAETPDVWPRAPGSLAPSLHADSTAGAGRGARPVGPGPRPARRRGGVAPGPCGVAGHDAWHPDDGARQEAQGARPWPRHPGRRRARGGGSRGRTA